MAALWDNKKQSAIERERAAQRLDCFLSILYLYPNCIELKDMEMLAKRERELGTIRKYTAGGFAALYLLGFLGHFSMRVGSLPYFKDVVMHSVLGVAGTYFSSQMSEKVAAEFYYNQVLIQMADKYNFTPEEVMDLQRNLNQYYIKRDREADLKIQ